MSVINLEIKRQKPTEFENVVELVQIRKPMAKDIYGLEFQGPKMHESMATLIARCSNLTEEEIQTLDIEEFPETAGKN